MDMSQPIPSSTSQDTNQIPNSSTNNFVGGPEPSKRSNKKVVLIIVVLVLVGGAILVFKLLNSTPHSNTSSNKISTSQIPAVKTEEAEVSITSSGFAPTNLRLKVNSQVTWTNNDTVSHTVMSSQLPDMESDPLNPKDSYSFTFEQQGSYQISTGSMNMVVTVID